MTQRWILIAAAVSSLRCASEPSDNPPSGPDSPAESLLVRALCGLFSRCTEQVGSAFADRSSCTTYFSERLACEQVDGGASSAALEACIGWLDAVSCQQLNERWGCPALTRPLECSNPLVAFAAMGAPGCADVLAGRVVELGEACDAASCRQGAFCKHGFGNDCSVCQPQAELDGACYDNAVNPLHQPCVVDAYCDMDARRCRAKLANTEPCETNRTCWSGFCRLGLCAAPLALDAVADDPFDHCVGWRVVRDGVCRDRLAAGQSCQWDSDCWADHACHQGVCTPFAVCVPRQVGEPCVSEPSACADGAFCNDTATPQACMPLVALGNPCEFSDDCGEDAYCDATTFLCIGYSGEGESCAGYSLCRHDLYCDSDGDTCAPLKANGAACNYNFECASDNCDGTCTEAPPCLMP